VLVCTASSKAEGGLRSDQAQWIEVQKLIGLGARMEGRLVGSCQVVKSASYFSLGGTG